MDRNREARRVNMTASTTTSNGLARRRHRTSSLRDSPEEDGPLELLEPTRLRDRGVKKDRDQDRDRDRERSSSLSRSKRRRGERLMHNNREDGGDDSTEESVNDDEEEDDDDGGGGGAIRMLPPNPPSSMSSSISNQHQFRKSFPPPSTTSTTAAATSVTANKVFRAPVLKGADEMIGVSVPRKARSASTKRSHECWISGTSGGAGGGVSSEQNHRQASTSPVRSSLAAAAASPAPMSPSSSNASIRKKMKPNGPKQHRPPKSSSTKSSSSIQEEIEIEVAEVLYGLMRQSQVPSKQEVNDSPKFESREATTNTNKSNNSDAKSRVSSPISNSPSANPQPPLLISQNSSSSATVVAPKRKRPRPVKYEDETPSPNPPIPNVKNNAASVSFSMPKIEIEQEATKFEDPSPKVEKNPGSAVENGSGVLRIPENPTPETTATTTTSKGENNINISVIVPDSKISSIVESESKEVVANKEETSSSLKKESPSVRSADDGVHHHHLVDSTATKAKSTVTENESYREEKFQIDLMAPPPPSKSSPERDVEIDFVPSDPKPMVSDVDTELRPTSKEEEKTTKIGKTDSVEPEEKRLKLNVAAFPEENEKKLSSPPLVKGIDLQLDLEKPDKEHLLASAPSPAPAPPTVSSNSKSHQTLQKTKLPEPNPEKFAQSGSAPLSMSVAGWPGGLPPLGYMAPLQGVVSMDGGAVSSAPIQPPHLLFSQPRLKRCSTHCYIARNISYHQQFTRMNPFWPAAAGTAPLYGAKTCNLNVMAPAELPGRNVSSVQDKGQGLTIYPGPGHTGKDKAPTAGNIADAVQRKQLLVQQALPTGTPSNILGPAFIFPLNQQQAAAAAAAAAASARPGSAKPLPNVGSLASSGVASGSVSSAATGAAATAMTFNYPNMPPNETQYLAILQNNGFPFPIPAHVGAPPTYRGTHAQAVPFFNGPFYSSQMLHASQLQQQQQAQPQQQQQQQQNQPSHQNSSISGSSSSSQKHLQPQQQRPHGSAINGATTNLPTFPASKSQSSSTQQQQNHHIAQPRQTRLESEVGGEDSPSTADSRVPRPNMNVYGQNFALPIPPPNFLMTPPTVLSGASGGSANSEKKQQQPQQQGLKAGLDQLTPQTFAMSFASINNTAAAAPGLDISSAAQNHAILQSFPEAARHSYHIMAAAAVAQATQHKKNFRIPEDSKSGGGDSSYAEEDRKSVAAKAPSNVGQSIAFSRTDFTDSSVSAISGNTVIDGSARSLNLTPENARGSRSVLPGAIATVGPPNSQPQQQQQQQQQQMMQFQKQQQFAVAAAAAAARSKTPATSNGAAYTDHSPASSSMAAKFPNALSAFPQNLVQSSNSSSPSQSSQWKNSVRTITSQVPSTTLPSTTSTVKNLPQQQGRPQQSQTQISFGGNPKSTPSQIQPPPSSAQSPSPPVVVGSPTTSSISKSTGGSPRTTTSTSAGNKPGQASSLISSQQAKSSSPSVPSRKSSPVGVRNVPSILGNPQMNSAPNTANKPQMQQQQQQQKHSLQQATLFFNNAYMHPQAAHSPSTISTSSATNAYYLQRRRPEQPQQQPGSSAATSSGVLSLCTPVPLGSMATSDPAKAMAAATAAAKGGVLPTPAVLHAQFAQSSVQLMPAGFPYVHAVPSAVQVKPTEQKQPAGE